MCFWCSLYLLIAYVIIKLMNDILRNCYTLRSRFTIYHCVLSLSDSHGIGAIGNMDVNEFACINKCFSGNNIGF